MGAVILALHAMGFGIVWLAVVPGHFHIGPTAFGLGLALTAYTLGVRHAFDADHITAIDNTTRKLMHAGERPLSVGFYFSLGHSTIVFALSAALAVGLHAAARLVHGPLNDALGLVGTVVAGLFLYVIAMVNLVSLVDVARVAKAMWRGQWSEPELEALLERRGLINRLLAGLMRTIVRPSQMYPVGVLFGLGFDTASEVALLFLAGGAAAANLPWYAVLALPVLFAAGMSLFDTLDGSFMNVVYGWAFARPVRKIYYNLTITGASVAVALFIGTVELASVLAGELGWQGGVWGWVAHFNLNQAGYVIVALFVAVWLLALAVWRLGRVEERFGARQEA
ncbi:MAG: HoxN/HupN/NixA family nickel/cobalt transporter [Actinomycetia bacterium]|nr:HoxN/HupN/NixA family nickel/cobalt transporter [Actinomycetes bacterium]